MPLIRSKVIPTRIRSEITSRWSQITLVPTWRMPPRSTLIRAGTSTKKTCIMFGYRHRAEQHPRLQLQQLLQLQLRQLLPQQLQQHLQLRPHLQRRQRRAREGVPRRQGHVQRHHRGPEARVIWTRSYTDFNSDSAVEISGSICCETLPDRSRQDWCSEVRERLRGDSS